MGVSLNYRRRKEQEKLLKLETFVLLRLSDVRWRDETGIWFIDDVNVEEIMTRLVKRDVVEYHKHQWQLKEKTR